MTLYADSKPFLCNHCSRLLGRRDGDCLIIGKVRVYVPESTPVTCGDCEKETRFYVQKDRKYEGQRI